jgi:hypothetical protein
MVLSIESTTELKTSKHSILSQYTAQRWSPIRSVRSILLKHIKHLIILQQTNFGTPTNKSRVTQ